MGSSQEMRRAGQISRRVLYAQFGNGPDRGGEEIESSAMFAVDFEKALDDPNRYCQTRE
jgi:hypothetical protein